MLKRMRKKLLAQSTLEYAVLIVLIVAALLASQVYIKRAMQGRLRSSADDIGEQFSLQAGCTLITTETRSKTNETVSAGVTTSNIMNRGDGFGEWSQRIATTEYDVNSVRNEYWGCSAKGKGCTVATDCCETGATCTAANVCDK